MFKRNPTKVAEAALAEKRRRHADLAQRLDGAEAAVAAAAERRRLLIEADQIDGPALSKADAACRTAEDRRDALADALRTIAEQISDAEAALQAERDRIERESAADSLLKRAGVIDAAAADLRDALEVVADRHRELVAAISSGGLAGEYESPETISAAILIAGIEQMPPGMLGRIQVSGWSSEEVTSAAERLQSGPLRARAEQVRAGEALAPIPSQVAMKIQPGVAIPEAVVVLRHPITFRGLDSSIVLIREGGCSIPAPVAAAARHRVRPWHACRPCGAQRNRAWEGRRAADTGVDLAEWIEAERAGLEQRAA